MEYLIKFDSEGKKIAAVVDKIHYSNDEERAEFINNGYISVTEKEWQMYCGVYEGKDFIRYVRDPETGNPVKYTPPAVDNTFKIKDREYKENLDFYVKAWAVAELANDNNLKSMLRKDYADWACRDLRDR